MTEVRNRHSYMTGDDNRLRHRRFIGCGAYGNVHEVLPSKNYLTSSFTIYPQDWLNPVRRVTHTEKAFARKLLHIPGADRKEIDREVRAITKLCGKGTHKNILSVLKFGELPNSAYYFIDMELCDLNLDTYIHRTDTPNPSESIPYFIRDASADLKASQIWNIMREITAGIEFIHGQNMVHRDVKPANGNSPPDLLSL